MNTAFSISPRLEELYRILTEAEKREISRYLNASYFNRQRPLELLHRYFTSTAAREGYDKHLAWKAAFEGQAFNEKKFRYLVSDLIAAIEDFIYTTNMLKQRPGYVQLLNDFFTTREAVLNKSSLENWVKSKKSGNEQLVSPQYYLEDYYGAELLEDLYSASRKNYSRYIAENRKGQAGGLDAFYVIEKLRQMCQVANDNNVFGFNMKCYYQPQVLQMLTAKGIKDNLLVQAYYSVYELLTRKEESSFYRLKKLIQQHGYDIDYSNMAGIFTYARNFCISRVNAGQSNFFNELFDLYEEGLEKGILLVNGEINEQNYKNIVTTALRTRQYEWANDFINDYRYKLNKKVRDNAFNYNMANYLFHITKYDKVPQYLQKVQLADLFYGLDARSLMIKCYYETDEKEAFMNAYQSFRIFVQRRKNVSEQHRRNYLNFLRFAKLLMNLRPRNKAAVTKLAEQINSAKAIADKSWLVEKVKAFET